MEIVLLIIGIICLIVGLAGAVLPLPGPPLSFVGLICLHYSHYVELNIGVMIGLGATTLVIALLDYYIPIWGLKQFGGTRYGSIGATLGLLVGFFVLPGIGLFAGTFIGAFVGEVLYGMATKHALKSAFGSFIGFLTGIFLKVLLCLVMIAYAVFGFKGW